MISSQNRYSDEKERITDWELDDDNEDFDDDEEFLD